MKYFFLAATLLLLGMTAVPVHAASGSVTTNTNTDLYFAGADVLFSNAGITVTYGATVYDNSTNAVITQNSSVSTGQTLRFVFTPHVYTDVSWYGAGGTFDTPYGDWIANAAAPAGPGCAAKDYLQTNYWGGYNHEDEYIALDVAPPTETLGGTTGLSCNAPTTDASGNVTEICTVTGNGNLTPSFNFAGTFGEFYYSNARYAPSYAGCIGSNTVLQGQNPDYTTYIYNASIPSYSISYPLIAPPVPNQPPATPTLSCPAGGQTSQALSFTLQGTDPDNDQIRYGMDWANSSSVSEWVPSSGYVPSGTSQTVPHSWATAGTYTIKALSQDSNSANSGWSSSCNVTITNPPTPTALLTATPSSVVSGSSATLQWSSTNATSCTGTGFSTGGATSGSVSTGALTTNQTYSLSCTGAGGTASDSAIVTVTPPLAANLRAGNTTIVNGPVAGTPVTLSAPASNIGNGASGSFPVLFQVQTSAGADVSLVDSPYLPGLAAGASAPASISYTFASAGTYQVRACANFNTSWVAVTSESDYSDNCGGWTPVTVIPPPPVTLTCSVSNAAPPLGQQITYTATGGWGPFPTFTWQASDGWTGTQGVTASTINRTFTVANQYGMQVTTASGPGTTVTANCPVVTAGTVCTNPTATITANPARVRVGDTTTLTWSASGVKTSCTVSGPLVNQTVPASSCNVQNPPAITTPAITAQSVYTVTCDGTNLNQVIVNVVPNFREF